MQPRFLFRLNKISDLEISASNQADKQMEMKVKFAGHILTIDPKLGEAVINRLRDLGIEEGQYIQCLQHGRGNRPAIFRIGDSVFTLEQNIARHISINEELTV